MALVVENRVDHAHLVRLELRFELSITVDLDFGKIEDSKHREEDRAGEEQECLDCFGDDHRLQTSKHGVDHRDYGNDQDRPHNRDSQECFKQFGTGEEADADVNQQRSENRDRGKKGAGRGAIATLEKLRQGGDSAAEIERCEKQCESDQTERGHPLEIAHHETNA